MSLTAGTGVAFVASHPEPHQGWLRDMQGCFVFQVHIAFRDVAVDSYLEDWSLLSPAWRSLYREVMQEIYTIRLGRTV